MRKLDYRQKLANELKNFDLTDSTINVYLAGTNNKMPSKYIRYVISQNKKFKHPMDKWGFAIKPYIKTKILQCNS